MLYGRCLRAACARLGTHQQGLASASRTLFKSGVISGARKKKLLELDVAFQVVRHSNVASVAKFDLDFCSELSRAAVPPLGASPCAQFLLAECSPRSVASTTVASTMPSADEASVCPTSVDASVVVHGAHVIDLLAQDQECLFDLYDEGLAPLDVRCGVRLPHHWQEMKSSTTGRVYYWSPKTGVSQYDKPAPETGIPGVSQGTTVGVEESCIPDDPPAETAARAEAARVEAERVAAQVKAARGLVLFITGLPVEIDQQRVLAVFGDYGTLDAAMFLQGKTELSALFTYRCVEESTWVVEHLNGNRVWPTVTIEFASATCIEGIWARRRRQG